MTKLLINPKATVKHRNKVWNTLTNKQKIIASCQDALSLLNRKLLTPISTYVDLQELSESDDKRSACELIEKGCKVCGIGAMFIGMVHASGCDGFDAWYVNNAGKYTITDHLQALDMSLQQVRQIEAVFENDLELMQRHDLDYEDVWSFRSEHDAQPGIEGRIKLLTAILKNIIANNGQFVLPTGETV